MFQPTGIKSLRRQQWEAQKQQEQRDLAARNLAAKEKVEASLRKPSPVRLGAGPAWGK